VEETNLEALDDVLHQDFASHFFDSSANMIAKKCDGNVDNKHDNMKSMHTFGWKTSME
jgi:hypothetical protein